MSLKRRRVLFSLSESQQHNAVSSIMEQIAAANQRIDNRIAAGERVVDVGDGEKVVKKLRHMLEAMVA